MFADLFPSGRGRPSVPADVVATTMVLQALEGLSDRQAVRRLETDIAWKLRFGVPSWKDEPHEEGIRAVPAPETGQA